HSDKGSQYVSLAYTERLKRSRITGINREYRRLV
ncbi:putative transposase, partial [Escherichia coli DEC3A]